MAKLHYDRATYDRCARRGNHMALDVLTLLDIQADLVAACQSAFDMTKNCPGNWQTQVAEQLSAAMTKAKKVSNGQ